MTRFYYLSTKDESETRLGRLETLWRLWRPHDAGKPAKPAAGEPQSAEPKPEPHTAILHWWIETKAQESLCTLHKHPLKWCVI